MTSVPESNGLAAVYVRVSSTLQEDGTSLATQEELCRERAAALGYTVPANGLFREVHTGIDLWERPQLAILRDSIRRREFGAVFVHTIDRLSRDPVHLGVIISEAEYAGVDVQFVDEPLDNSPEGQLIRFVRGYAAKVEHEKIRERSLRGRHARVRGGKLIPGPRPLYGYRFTSDDKGAYAPDPITAPIVQRIFAASVRGETLRAIAASLSAEHVPSPANGGPWWHSTLREILRNPTYIGQAVGWTGTWVKEHQPGATTSSRRRRARPVEQHVPLPNAAPALVDLATFEAVQDRLKTNQRTAIRNNRHPEDWLLRAGYIRCGLCGWNMQAYRQRTRDGGTTPVYRCNKGNAKTGTCRAHSIRGHIIDSAAWGRVVAILTRPEIIAAEVARLRADDPTENDIEAVDRRIAAVERQIRQMVNELAAFGPAVAAAVRERAAGLETEHARLQAERERVLARRAAWEQAQERLGDIQAWCNSVAVNLAEQTYAQKREALEALGIAVTVWPSDHTPRWTITTDIPFDASIVDSSSGRAVHKRSLHLRWTAQDTAS